MAALSPATESPELKNQGIRSARRIEWFEKTFSTASAADTFTVTFKEIKTVGAVIGCPFSHTISGNVVTFTLPYAIAAGTIVFGLVEGA